MPPRKVGTHDDDSIRLPRFDPVAGDPDELQPSVRVRSWIASPRHRSRRSRAWLTGVLILAAALQAIPTYLWLRGRLESVWSKSKRETPREQSESAAQPHVAVQPPAPLAGDLHPPLIPPVGTGSIPSAPSTMAATGSLSVSAPFPLQVFLNGQLAGSTATGSISIKLPVGSPEVEFVNTDLGYRSIRRVAVQASRTVRVQVRAPLGLLNINASPWAEVYIDDRLIGQTPIGNFRVPIGRREVTFRHPQLGERRVSAVVTLKQPARVAVDMDRR